MDIYAEMEKKVYDLRQEIVSSIKNVLHEKGYNIGDSAENFYDDIKFEIIFDRILINNYHPDNLSIEELVDVLRSAIHVIPKTL